MKSDERSFVFVGAVVAATASAIVFLFLQFETKADSNEKQNALELRLVRIEQKLDRLLTGHVR